MPDYSFVLYDHAPLGNAANITHVLFQTAAGADATHTPGYTNSRGAGQLPQNEKFMVERLSCSIDVNGLVADAINTWVQGVVRIRVSDEVVFEAPLRECVGKTSFSGMYTQASAAEENAVGLMGDGYELRIPLVIPGGTAFRVEIFQTTALSTTAQNMCVSLHGTLTRQ